jgi:hypothetical protein
MNVRFGEGAVRFRISTEELALLLAGKKIEEPLILAGKHVLLTLDPSGTGKELDFVYEDGRIGLKASKSSLEELDRQGRQKDGIASQSDGSAISLQVDLKTYSRKQA